MDSPRVSKAYGNKNHHVQDRLRDGVPHTIHTTEIRHEEPLVVTDAPVRLDEHANVELTPSEETVSRALAAED